ncbi:hypothetical protein [Chromohalobacter israelensis]
MIITADYKKAKRYECALLLVKDNWDDYSYQTKFYVWLYDGSQEIELGYVKIISPDLDDDSSLSNVKKNTSTSIPEVEGDLPDGYFSLGQSLEYYRKISELGVGSRVIDHPLGK